jgi:hypothetical protein
MNLFELRKANAHAIGNAETIMNLAENARRDLTAAEQQDVDQCLLTVKVLAPQIEQLQAKNSLAAVFSKVGGAGLLSETQMAHQKKDKVSGAYDHAKYLIPRTYMMQDWADFLDETLRGGKYKLIPPSYRIEREQRSEDDLRSKKRDKAN